MATILKMFILALADPVCFVLACQRPSQCISMPNPLLFFKHVFSHFHLISTIGSTESQFWDLPDVKLQLQAPRTSSFPQVNLTLGAMSMCDLGAMSMCDHGSDTKLMDMKVSCNSCNECKIPCP